MTLEVWDKYSRHPMMIRKGRGLVDWKKPRLRFQLDAKSMMNLGLNPINKRQKVYCSTPALVHDDQGVLSRHFEATHSRQLETRLINQPGC